MTSRRRLIVSVAAIAIVLLLGRAVAAAALDYAWYDGLGAGAVWRARAVSTLVTAAVTASLGTLFAFANLLAVRGSVVSLVLPRRVANLEIGEEVPPRYLLAASLFAALLLGAALTEVRWQPLARFVYGDAFGENDPYFGRDLGFFAHWLPLERSLYLWALLATLLVAAVVVFLYALTPSLRWERGTLRVSQYVRRHLTMLAATLLILLAWSYRLDAFSLLGSGSGALGEFSYVDHRVLVPANVLLSVLTLAGALALLWTGWAGQLRAAFATVSALLLLSLGLHQLAPAIARRFAGQQDPVVRERPYLATRAAYTRRAFALAQLAGGSDSVIARNPGRATPSWDDGALLRAGSRSRGGDATSTVGGRMLPSGEPAALVVVRGTAADGSDWGAQYFSLSRADDRGAPVMIDARGAPTSDWIALAPVLVVDSGDGYAVVADSSRRVAGVPIADGVTRLVPAWALQNFRLLSEDLPHPSPRLVVHRSARRIVEAVAPLFEQGTHVTPAIDGDTLLWMIDLYTTAPDYPLSAHVVVEGTELAYLRHAATAVVNSATGRVRLVADSLATDNDPLTRGWRRRFPGLFVTTAQLEADVGEQLPAPVRSGLAQREAFAMAGTTTEGVAERRSPASDGADSVFAGAGPARFATGRGALALSLPILRGEDRIDGVIVVRGGVSRGSRWVPDTAGIRWARSIDRLRGADSTGAAQPRDARVAHGPVRVIPGEDGLTLTQSAYAVRAQSPPSLLGVAVLHGDSLRVGKTVLAAYGELPNTIAPPASRVDLRVAASALYDSLRADQRRGDWRAYADHWEALGRLLGRPPR
ncbi:MAG TPA: UPF0182 family protein [Gemmatimonadaceae bacterium]|nr:UPF0182 family protein [Gemmatimonadaceae bacterium]